MSATNCALIERFYTAFGAHDGAAMGACYAPGATFSDPVFPALHDDEPGAMWRMLTDGPSDLEVSLLEVTTDEERGTARWRATYTFTRTGRPVVNDVAATFRFANGQIIEHRDVFSFPRWARQALGPVGWLGWTPVVRSSVRRQARTRLDAFIQGER